jgi:hypothetical protein
MELFRILSAVLAIAATTAVCAPVKAQTDQDASAPQPAKVREVVQRPMPFSLGSQTAAAAASVEFRSYDRMTPRDRDLAADAESTINERAGYDGLEFNQGKWSYQQVVCSALPNHLFLQFTRNNGAGDLSVFSASIPRGGLGKVRIIPILRRSYSLFSPAPVNELTISAFNHIRAEEHPDKTPDWLATGLCYAALAGAHPQVGLPEAAESQKLPAATPGILVIPVNGGAVISFTDVASLPRPMEWAMTFDGAGKMLKATHSAAPKSNGRVIVATPFEVQGKSVPETPIDAKAIRLVEPQGEGKVIQRSPAEVQGKPVPQAPEDLKGTPVPQ